MSSLERFRDLSRPLSSFQMFPIFFGRRPDLNGFHWWPVAQLGSPKPIGVAEASSGSLVPLRDPSYRYGLKAQIPSGSIP